MLDGSGGSFQVTAVQSSATICVLDHWFMQVPQFQRASLHVVIQCRTRAGVPAASGFFVTFMDQTSLNGLGGGTQYYLRADKKSKASYTPLVAEQWSSTGDQATIKRSSAGVYTVTLAGMTNYGSAQVSAYGGRATGATLDRRCVVSSIASKITHLPAGATAEKIGVHCYDSNGHLADSQFTLAYVN